MAEVASPLQLRQTALNSMHRRMHGRMVPFAGWEMPVEYSGIIPEHMAVRTAVGLFDVSHMGEIEVSGPEALDLIQYVCSNDASRLSLGQAQYSGLLTDRGTFVDDLLVHKLADNRYLLVVNAANCERDFEHISSYARRFAGARVENTSDRYTQLAIQGPKASAVLQPLSSTPLASLKYYWFTNGSVLGVPAIIARTGYTGEDGYEIYFSPDHSERIWTAILDAGSQFGILPCGLGARNTLRLEASMALYGHEIDDTTTVWEARLDWICKLTKGDFIARSALEKQKTNGLSRILVGFEMIQPGIARDGYPVSINGNQIGAVTSGSPAPFLRKNIGMAYVPPGYAASGTDLEIQIRSRTAKAKVVQMPFYKRAR
jgi:aminomethyltransferase